MKFITQIITIIIPFLIAIFILFVEHKIDFSFFQNPLAFLNIASDMIVASMYFVIYIMLILKEKRNKRVCYTIAQYTTLLGCTVNIMSGFMSWYWYYKVQSTGIYDPDLNTIYKIIDLIDNIHDTLVCQLILASYFALPLFPWLQISPRKPIGDYAIAKSQKYGIDPDVMKQLMEESNMDQMNDSNVI